MVPDFTGYTPGITIYESGRIPDYGDSRQNRFINNMADMELYLKPSGRKITDRNVYNNQTDIIRLFK
jgi:hypothetical protein